MSQKCCIPAKRWHTVAKKMAMMPEEKVAVLFALPEEGGSVVIEWRGTHGERDVFLKMRQHRWRGDACTVEGERMASMDASIVGDRRMIVLEERWHY